MSADVLYGDTKLSPGAVRVTLQRTAPDAQASLRVQASVVIDEPVVSVLVRAGCTAPFTRNYVLLADPVSEPVASPPAAAGGVPAVPRALNAGQLPVASASGGNAQAGPNVSTANGPSAAPVAAPTPRATVAQSTSERPRSPPAAVTNRANTVVRKPAPAQPAPASTPRLELDAIDLSLVIERDPTLRLSLSLLSEPSGSEEARAAAGLLWKAINASPQDILRDNTRLQALSAELSALREAQASSQATINELTSRQNQAQQWQWLVVVLGVLLALALAGLLWAWRRLKTRPSFSDSPDAWTQAKALSATVRDLEPTRSTTEPASLVNRDSKIAFNKNPSKLRPNPTSADLTDSSLMGAANSAPALFSSSNSDFALSQAASRSMATEDLFDIQQQADFFISLGEDEQAIQLLRDHIAESQVPSPLTYLDLLKIYHRLGRQEEYERLRTDFNRLFNAGAPVFDQFSDGGRGLEFYERALGRIQALWPEPRVLDVIEQSIFRETGDLETEVFDLEAYRELLLLYTLAKEVIKREAVDSMAPQNFVNTKVQALKATARRGAASKNHHSLSGDSLPKDQQPRVSPNLGLDVNLDDFFASSTREVPLPTVDFPMVVPDAAEDRDAIGNKDSHTLDFEALDFTLLDDGVPPRPADKSS